ncbi:MAG: PLD nuclease N-terminal domain-containing protein [Bacteroidota bacterium]|nr:PLD nuclease N-terminal domain-containing protein [Bacteroidota bacterium]MDX5447410.1 PLD nuclease N-terminal domain-containing protein [Bacteroidota bacterium]MDX5505315.1 PLD nuclease N-terminal domain-containing protein [Bacteroidota bacterium]
MELLEMVGPWQLLLIFIFISLVLLLPLIALIDILRNDFENSNKLIWVLIVLLFPFLGAILYFIIGSKQKIPKP